MGIFGKFFGKKLERALLQAAKHGNLATVQSLLDDDSALESINSRSSVLGETPLHVAVQYGHAKVVEFLVAKGVDVNVISGELQNLHTPLHDAASKGYTEIAEFLVSKGADIEARNKLGRTPLDLAVMWGRMQTVETLIANRADIHTEDNSGTPLLYTALQALPGGPKPAGRKAYGHLDLSTLGERKYRKEIIELLITKGADVNAKTPEVLTPLHCAASHGQAEVAELLLAKGADVNAINSQGASPLHTASHYGKTEVAELLLRHGADINSKAKKGWTPLHIAAQEGKIEVAELLLAKGADVNAWTACGRVGHKNMSPLRVAKNSQNRHLVKLLKKHGGKDSSHILG